MGDEGLEDPCELQGICCPLDEGGDVGGDNGKSEQIRRIVTLFKGLNDRSKERLIEYAELLGGGKPPD